MRENRKWFLASTVSLLAPLAVASGPSSASYSIPWDVIGGGGGTSMSASYTATDTVGQPSTLGASSSTSYVLEGGFWAAPDSDADAVRDFMDNCSLDPNADQRDTNSDGYGNLCDTDLNNDGITNAADLGLLKSVFFSADPDADFNGDGIVNAQDLATLKVRFFTTPGPSGLVP